MGDIQIIYRAGKDNALADALSRNPQGPPPEDGIAEGESQVAMIDEKGIAEGDSPVSKQLIELLQLTPTPPPPQVDDIPMIVEQKRDPVVQAMVQFLENVSDSQEDRCTSDPVRSGRRNFVLHIDLKQRYKKRVVVPSHLKEKLIHEVQRTIQWTFCNQSYVQHPIYNLLVGWNV